jgi:thiamine-phosphate pyrophosphorylase
MTPPPDEPDKNASADMIPLLRVLDAEGNRAREGLRVVEDFARFVLDDRHLTDCCKQLRHQLTAVLARIPPAERLAARETQADVGTTLTTPAEQRRTTPRAVLEANFGRLQEALRSLEEFGKLHDPQMGAELEQLRYRSYTLHRAMVIEQESAARLAGARLYVLVDGRATAAEFETLVRTLIGAGVDVLQLRDKNLDDRTLLERGRLLSRLTRGSPTLAIVNDRPDLAVLAQADGVHVGQDELTVKDARTIVGPQRLVGVSTHSIQQARQAVLDGANYIGVGPTFPSGTKSFSHYPGLELVAAVAAEIRLPAFAIGGIGPANLDAVLAAGLPRAAVSGAITTAADPAAVARAMREKMKDEG